MSILQAYSLQWPKVYESEAELIRSAIPTAVDIQHIGSTSIPGMVAKPIIDIGVLIKSADQAEEYVGLLETLGYRYYPKSSSSERLFFRKGDPTAFHLSLAYQNKGSFWKRQLTIRDFLRIHPEAIQEYTKLKLSLLNLDPAGGEAYLNGKSDFVQNILKRAKQ